MWSILLFSLFAERAQVRGDAEEVHGGDPEEPSQDHGNAAGSGEREDVRNVDVSELQQEIGIADVITELETYFYGDSVDYAVVNL